MGFYDGMTGFHRKIEERFYEAFEARIWVRAAFQFRSEAEPPLMRSVFEDSSVRDWTVEDRREVAADFIGTKRYFLRMLRYQSSEVLLLLLLSVSRGDSYLAFSTEVRNDKLNAAFTAISSRKIPEGCRWKIKGKPVTFPEWVSVALVGEVSEVVEKSVCDFVVQEAARLSDKRMHNAIKHGRANIDVSDQRISISVSGFDENPLIDAGMLSAFHSVRVRGKPKGHRELCRVMESVDESYEETALFIASRLMLVIKAIRLAQLRSEDRVDIQMVDNISLEQNFLRMSAPPFGDRT